MKQETKNTEMSRGLYLLFSSTKIEQIPSFILVYIE